MKVLRVFLAMLCVSWYFLVPLAETAPPTYLKAVPLSQALTHVKVGEVIANPRWVPIITWGGDIATTVANGNSRQTSKGSIFDKEGLNITLFRQDDFRKQVEAYLTGQTPYLRGTMGMINMAAEIANRDPRTELVIVYQLTWSTGGDVWVVDESIRSPKDLRGKTIVTQLYGPHLEYLNKILLDASLSPRDVTIRWTKDLTGTSNDVPSAFRNDRSNNAALLIIPDALALTSQGTVGDGSEDSRKGAKILLTTKTANHVIADVYAVRRDFFQKNRGEVEKFVHGLMLAQESLKNVVKNKTSQPTAYRSVFSAAAGILLDNPKDIANAEGMYGNCEFVGYRGNVDFFTNSAYPRNLGKIISEIQPSTITMGFLSSKIHLNHAGWDYARLQSGLTDIAGVALPKFNSQATAAIVAKRQQQNTLAQGELFSFEVYFEPNQNTFSAELYHDSFDRVVKLVSTYGGALLTIEGHSDPLAYLRLKKDNAAEIVLNQTKQAAKNLSLTRANAVRDNLIAYAKSKGVTLDSTQLVSLGHGITKPKNGMCGEDPCAPKTEGEWRNNMRVQFRIVQVEAESSVFTPLGK